VKPREINKTNHLNKASGSLGEFDFQPQVFSTTLPKVVDSIMTPEQKKTYFVNTKVVSK
jgi:hypothetical protein